MSRTGHNRSLKNIGSNLGSGVLELDTCGTHLLSCYSLQFLARTCAFNATVISWWFSRSLCPQ